MDLRGGLDAVAKRNITALPEVLPQLSGPYPIILLKLQPVNSLQFFKYSETLVYCNDYTLQDNKAKWEEYALQQYSGVLYIFTFYTHVQRIRF
jgi:hypothetical protein